MGIFVDGVDFSVRAESLKNGTIFEISSFKIKNFFFSRHIFTVIVLFGEETI